MEHTQDVEALDWRPDSSPATPAIAGDITTRIDLPSGGWAEVKDAKTIRAKHRKRVLDQLNTDRLSSGKAGVAFDMADGLIIMMVEKWDIPYLPGVTRPLDDVASVEELMIPDYDVLTEALAGAREVLFPQPATIDGARTPGSPTRPDGD